MMLHVCLFVFTQDDKAEVSGKSRSHKEIHKVKDNETNKVNHNSKYDFVESSGTIVNEVNKIIS